MCEVTGEIVSRGTNETNSEREGEEPPLAGGMGTALLGWGTNTSGITESDEYSKLHERGETRGEEEPLKRH
jgi:hypothetical protein